MELAVPSCHASASEHLLDTASRCPCGSWISVRGGPAAAGLPHRVEDRRSDGAAPMVAPAHLARRQQAEAEPEEADVERRRERDRADLPEEPEVRADGGEAAEDRRGERAAAEQKQQQERPAGRLQGVGPTLEGDAP